MTTLPVEAEVLRAVPPLIQQLDPFLRISVFVKSVQTGMSALLMQAIVSDGAEQIL